MAPKNEQRRPQCAGQRITAGAVDADAQNPSQNPYARAGIKSRRSLTRYFYPAVVVAGALLLIMMAAV